MDIVIANNTQMWTKTQEMIDISTMESGLHDDDTTLVGRKSRK